MRLDSVEAQTMRDCQRGMPKPGGGSTGSVCLKRDLCRQEGRCNFVASMERHLERIAGHTRAPSSAPRIEWHPGYDGHVWAL